MDCDLAINGNSHTKEQNNPCSLLPNGEEGVRRSSLLAPQVTTTDQQQEQPGTKKRKCRGNRKLQRHRRRLRAKICDTTTVQNLQQMTVTRQNDIPHNEMKTQISTTTAAALNEVYHAHLYSDISMFYF